MRVNTKTNLLHWAESLDALRVFPRLFLVGTTMVISYMLIELMRFYIHIPSLERTVNVTAGISVFTAALATLQGFSFKVYSDGGRNWGPPQVTTSTSSSTTSATGTAS